MSPIAIKINRKMAGTYFPSPRPSSAEKPLQFLQIEPAQWSRVEQFYRSHGYKIKCGAGERVYVMAHDDLIAAARLVPQGSGHYWLRNLLVAGDWRRRGIASKLMRELLPDIAPHGCYCFALPHLVAFYTEVGFVQNPDHCPADIADTFHIYRRRGRDWILMGYRSP